MAQETETGQVTHDYLRAEISGVRAEIAQGFGAANTAIANMQTENADRFGKVNTEIADRFGEMKSEIARDATTSTRWTIGVRNRHSGFIDYGGGNHYNPFAWPAMNGLAPPVFARRRRPSFATGTPQMRRPHRHPLETPTRTAGNARTRCGRVHCITPL